MSGINAEPPEEKKPRKYVLDSFALIAYLDAEPSGLLVRQLIEQASSEQPLFLSVINLGEVVYDTERDNGRDAAEEALASIRRLPISIIGAEENRVLAAAHIKANYRVSYADAFAIALAQELNATIVTGDPEFRNAERIVDILWLTEPRRRALRERRTTYRLKPSRKKQAR